MSNLYTNTFQLRICRAAVALLLLTGAEAAVGQPGHRGVNPDPMPELPCSPGYRQRAGATYVAANHLTGSFGAADLGATGVNTTVDAGTYGGTVVFNGVYHVRGNVRFANGTVELRPGTVFYVEGLNGQFVPTTTFPDNTVIEVDNASLDLTGAVIRSTCPRAWGGIRLLDRGRIRTWADPAATAPAGRSAICDAFVGVNVIAPPNQRSNGEYYLNNTDFVNNYIGVFDYYKNVARPNEGAHYCTFSSNAAMKDPIANPVAYPPIGIRLAFSDQVPGYDNYAAASIDHCSFHHLEFGIYGAAQHLRIVDNTFDYFSNSAIDLDTQSGAGYFTFTPMYVQRNDIMIRGTNPVGAATTWGIKGGVYAQGNFIHGDDANPATNGVQQVGMFMPAPDNSTQTGNTFEQLDRGIDASVDGWFPNGQRDITGNLFRNVTSGINTFTDLVGAMDQNDLYIRCNSFENPGSLPGAVALNMDGPEFPQWLGAPSYGNGNRFVTPGLPFIEPILSSVSPAFIYWAIGNSTQEDLSLGAQNGWTYLFVPTAGNPATACTGAGHSNGINNRAAAPLLGPAVVQNAYDSLQLPIPQARRHALLTIVMAATAQRNDFGSLETYVAGLPTAATEAHATLGVWLLHTYRRAHREADAQRVRAALLARHPANLDLQAFVQLSDVQARLASATDPLAPPAPADVAALKAVAASGTPSARVACPAARRFAPACPCRFPASAAAKALSARDHFSASTKAQALGTLYPNPANGTVHVPYALPAGAGPARLEVRNALGQLVQQLSLTDVVGEALLDVRSLPTGLYTCTLALRGAGSPVVRRLAVE